MGEENGGGKQSGVQCRMKSEITDEIECIRAVKGVDEVTEKM